MDEIFTVTDRDGDTFDVETLDGDDHVLDVAVNGVSAFLTADQVDGLIAAITPYGVKAKAATTILAGREYRLLPGARHAFMDHPSFLVVNGATRVKVEHGPDCDGDYWVTAIDGRSAGDSAWIGAQYIAPMEAAPPAPAATIVVDGEYRLLPGALTVQGHGVYFDNDVTKVCVERGPDGAGDYCVRALNGDEDGTTQYVGPAYLAALDAPADVPLARWERLAAEDDGPAFLDAARVEAVEYIADNFTEFTAAELLDVARFLLLLED